MKKYLIHHAFGLGLVLFLFIGIPLNGSAYNIPLDSVRKDIGRYDLRIAYAQMTDYDWDNPDELMQLGSTEVAPCVSVVELEDGYLIPNFYGNLPLMFRVDQAAGTASIPFAIEVFSDSVIGTGRHRVDSLRYVYLLSTDFISVDDQTDVMGAINEDGTISFDEGNGFLYYYYSELRTYKNGHLQSTDTIWRVSPVFEGLTLLKPNGEHEFKQVYYTEGMDPLTTDVVPDEPNDAGHPKPSIHIPDSVWLSSDVSLFELHKKKIPEEQTSWRGGSGRPIKPIDGPPSGGDIQLDGKPSHGGLDLEDYLNSHVVTYALRPGNTLCKWLELHGLQHGFDDGTCGFGRGGSGRPIKPITGGDDVLASLNSPQNTMIECDVTNKVYMFQGTDEENGKYVCVLNLYGAGLVNRFNLGENGALDFPVQPIGWNDEAGDYCYNYSAPAGHIDQLEPGNSGTAASDSLTWGVTVPFNPTVVDGDGSNSTRGLRALHLPFGPDWSVTYYWETWPSYYDNNRLYYTDGQQFDVPEPQALRVSAVTNKIDSALRGESSIREVTDLIGKLLNSVGE